MNLRQYSQAAAQPGIFVERIENLKIPVPPASERNRIADYLDTKIAEIESVIRREKIITEKLRELRASIISEVVTGEIDVRGEVPQRTEVAA